MVLDRDPAVLRMPALDDVQVRDDLEAADHRRRHRRLDEQDVLKLAVDPVAHPQAALLRIEVDVGRLAVARAFEDLADQLRQRGRDGLLLELLADVAVMLGAVRRERPRRQPPSSPPAPMPARSPLSGQCAQPLECELVEQLGRDQIELEDRLPQVALCSSQ